MGWVIQLQLMALAFVLVPLIDYVWLARIASRFYLSQLGTIARTENGVFSPVLWPAGVVYVCLALGVVLLALPRVEAGGSWVAAFVWGGVLGFVVYGVYDMTNLSLVDRWPLWMSFVDMAWGTFLCGTVTAICHAARGWLTSG